MWCLKWCDHCSEIHICLKQHKNTVQKDKLAFWLFLFCQKLWDALIRMMVSSLCSFRFWQHGPGDMLYVFLWKWVAKAMVWPDGTFGVVILLFSFCFSFGLGVMYEIIILLFNLLNQCIIRTDHKIVISWFLVKYIVISQHKHEIIQQLHFSVLYCVLTSCLLFLAFHRYCDVRISSAATLYSEIKCLERGWRVTVCCSIPDL